MDKKKGIAIAAIFVLAGVAYWMWKKKQNAASAPVADSATSTPPLISENAAPSSLSSATVEPPETAILAMIDKIKQNTEWYNSVVSKAAARNVPVEEMLRTDALYMIKGGK